MQSDRRFLEGLGWETKWIEFEGGHVIAPQKVYKEAADWLEDSLKGPVPVGGPINSRK